jgi:hypothetical protein
MCVIQKQDGSCGVTVYVRSSKPESSISSKRTSAVNLFSNLVSGWA